MTEWNYINDNNKDILLIKNGEKDCKVRPYLSISDVELVSERLQESQDVNYRWIMAEIIANHTRNFFSPSEINEQEDALFEKYIDICISGDSRLKESYEAFELPDNNKRFVLAVDTTGRELAKELAKELSETWKKSIGPTISKIAQSTEIRQNFAQAIAPALKMSETLKSITSDLQATWQSTWLGNLKGITKSYKSMIPDYSKMFWGISSALQELVNNIHIPTITEEDKKQLIQSYTTWGKLGWTPPPNAEFNVFNTEPKDAKDAYQRLRGYFTASAMDELFTEIRQLKHIKKTDFDEAVNCFKTGYYKACSLILFSLIDSRLIRSQIDEERNGAGMRMSGKRAAKKLFGRIESKYIKESMLFTVFNQVNILSALETVFEAGKDFKVQPTVINRNFVDHGMLYRKVTRKDCIMLFLLLYNFTMHLNSFVGT